MLLGKACVCTVSGRSAFLSEQKLVCFHHCDRDMASQCVSGPCRGSILGKWERMLSKTSDYFLFRDAWGPKDPGRCAFGPKKMYWNKLMCSCFSSVSCTLNALCRSLKVHSASVFSLWAHLNSVLTVSHVSHSPVIVVFFCHFGLLLSSRPCLVLYWFCFKQRWMMSCDNCD